MSAVLYKQGKPAPEDGYKLSSNENPYPTLPSVLAAVGSVEDLNRYPDGSAAELTDRLAALNHTTPDHILVGPGSINVLLQLIMGAAQVGDEVIMPWRSFEGYPSVVTVSGATAVPVPLTDTFDHDLDAMVDAITSHTRVILLCTPNNPTGNVLHREDVERFLARVPRDILVLLDEAYIDFVRDETAVDGLELVADHPNLATVRTFSKAYGLPGLRIGYAVAQPRIVHAGQASGLPFAVSSISLAAAVASIDARDELMAQVDTIVATRNRIVAGLMAQGWDIPDAQGNFVWLPTGDRTNEVAAVFDRYKIVPRVFPGAGIRVSVGEEASAAPVLAATAEIAELLGLGA